jgi:uncharacterized protein YodC (DUF2158 family)
MTIIAGSIVQLKSGSCDMTVDSVSPDGKSFLCIWHDDQQQEHRGIYCLNSLILITYPAKS